MKIFTFQYYTTKNSLTVNDFSIKAQMGPLVKKEFVPASLQYFYRFKTVQYETLFATYTNEKGKTKKIQLYSSLGQPQFDEMMQYMEEKFSGHSLNHLPQAEALKMMNVANPNKWVPPFVFILLSVCMTIFFYPMLRHYFDRGYAKTTIENYISNPDLGTRNLTINGYLLDVGVKETITSSKNSPSTSTYIPMVGENWKEGDPVKIILEFGSLSESGFDDVVKQTEFTGVVRDVWWEGIASDNLDFLKDKYKLNFPDKPVLMEVTGEVKNDGFVIWVWGGTLIFILVLVVVVAVKMNPKKP
ncbi:MAG TPA: hypothetical protein VNZ49_14690 [Bacteroidia bacterium]|jgi:hypothetical protein|nr:hypothetical protein [Bacteroidia bacterium]